MLSAPFTGPKWIARPSDLRAMIADLERYPRLAIDTESNGLHAYQEQVCLLQFSTGECDYLVDPLALPELTGLEAIFNAGEIEKVFHASEYDILCLKRDFGFQFTNLFDTMLAARILGVKEIGLGSLLQAEFDLELDKRHQRANWGKRPLPPAMLNYARLDTHYLLDLRDRLYERLVEKDLLGLAREDFQRMCDLKPLPLEAEPITCWHIAGPRDVTPRQAAVLQGLVEFRDRQARSSNVPVFKILSNQTLLEIAQRAPEQLEELEDIRGITSNMIDRFGADMIRVIERGTNAKPIHPPRNHRPPEAVLRRLELLRNWRKETGREMGVESDVILPRDVLGLIAEQNPRSREDLAEIMRPYPWRFEHYGDQILNLLSPKRQTV
jgi:ribonuclease D